MTAFRAVYADWKLIKTRSTVQVVLEIPIEQADAAYEVLGGMPQPSKERWFAVAALAPGAAAAKPDPVDQPRPDRAKRDWRDLSASQQAAIRCNDPTFCAFLREELTEDWRESFAAMGAALDPDVAAECVRMICAVSSRRDLDGKDNHGHRVLWHQLDSKFQAWKAKERVGA